MRRKNFRAFSMCIEERFMTKTCRFFLLGFFFSLVSTFCFAQTDSTQLPASAALSGKADSAQTAGVTAPPTDSPAKKDSSMTHTLLSIAIILLLLAFTAGFLWYLVRLQKQFLQACKEDDQIALFSQSALGLPAGSVRAASGLVLVVFTFGFLVLSVINSGGVAKLIRGALGQLKGISLTIAALALLILILAAVLVYMFIIQKQFYKGCRDKDQLALYSQSPLGLPIGSIRSVLALLIVIISLCFIVLNVFEKLPVPEALVAILGSVIGFYFGTRSGAGADEGMKLQLEQSEQQKEQVMNEKDKEEASSFLKKAQKGIAMSKTVIKFLPKEVQEKYGGVIEKLEKGLDTAENLSKLGNLKGAADKAKEVFDIFRKGNPVKDFVEKATKSFGRVLGPAIPPIAIIGSVIAIGTKLAGMAFQKWKARVLHLPFSPAVIPLTVVDANTGFSLLVKTPIFKTAFTQQLTDNDRDFMKTAVEDFIKEEDHEALWTKYETKGTFESREQFDEGLEEFRRLVAARELQQDLAVVESKELAEVGGPEKLIAAIDQLHTDDEALGDLDMLVTSVENLHRNGEPVPSIFEKVKEEMAS